MEVQIMDHTPLMVQVLKHHPDDRLRESSRRRFSRRASKGLSRVKALFGASSES